MSQNSFQISMPRIDLAQAVSAVLNDTDPRSTMPILANVQLIAKDKELIVVATDLIKTSRIPVKADVQSPGEITIPAKLLSQALDKIAAETVTLTVGADDDKNPVAPQTAVLRGGKARITLPWTGTRDFPKIAILPSDVDAQADALLRPLLALCVPFTVRDQTRPMQSGVHVHNGIMGASNGHAAMFVRYLGSLDNVMVPTEFYGQIPNDPEVDFAQTGTHLFVRADDRVSSIKLMDVPVPNALTAMAHMFLDGKKDGYSWVHVNVQEFAQSVALLAVAEQNESTPRVKFAFSEDGKDMLLTNNGASDSLSIQDGSSDMASHTFLHTNLQNETVQVPDYHVAAKLLGSVLKTIGDRECSIGFPTNIAAPLVVRVQTKGDGAMITSMVGLVMPLSRPV